MGSTVTGAPETDSLEGVGPDISSSVVSSTMNLTSTSFSLSPSESNVFIKIQKEIKLTCTNYNDLYWSSQLKI